MTDVNINGVQGAGGGVVWGWYPGTSTVASKFYTIPAFVGNATTCIMDNVEANGHQGPAFEFTGCQNYKMTSSGGSRVGTTGNSPIIRVINQPSSVGSGQPENSILAIGLRTESHTSVTGITALSIETSSIGSFILGDLCTDSAGAVIGSANANQGGAQLLNSEVISTCDNSPWFNLTASSTTFQGDKFLASDSGITSLGTLTGGLFTSNEFYSTSTTLTQDFILTAIGGFSNRAFNPLAANSTPIFQNLAAKNLSRDIGGTLYGVWSAADFGLAGSGAFVPTITGNSGFTAGHLAAIVTSSGEIGDGGPAPVRGTANLTAGTVTINNAAACSVGACVYKLTNCGNSGTVGILSVGTITAGTSFVINSSSATDTSTVCWQIN